MLLDFDAMEATELAQFYGGERTVRARMHTDGHNRIMMARLEPGASIGMHIHETGSEIVYVIQGTGRANFDGGEEILRPGVCHYCPKGHAHGIRNDGMEDLVIFAAVPRQ